MSLKTEPLVYIGLGANLGDTRHTLQSACHVLAAHPHIKHLRVSHFYRSKPVAASGPDYLNAVAELRTGLSATDLLHTLQAIEDQHGRERPYHNAPRTLDLDLLYYGGQTIALPALQVPHPRMRERAFVLAPMLELVAPDFRLDGVDLQTLLHACRHQHIVRLVSSKG